MLNAVWVAQSTMNLLLNVYDNKHGADDAHQLIDEEEEEEEAHAAIWIPPEAAHDYDDDDDAAAGGDSSSKSTAVGRDDDSDADAEPANRRQRAMAEAMNGQLKVLVSRFLASAGIISLPKTKQQAEDGGESWSWVEIITSLSWEAALLIKPADHEMDPASYVKVKRIPSGTPTQCEVIQGLVFTKNVAHKHMPTRCHNSNLLLLAGALGEDSHAALSSFDSMEQEKDRLEKVISQVVEICSPNVIMVEKTVSRDIQELLLKKGVTLVLDMKLHRLRRIARCLGSPVTSFSDVLLMTKPKLNQCDYFHIEKVVDEHNHTDTGQGAKRPSKTLMFLEGFLNPLGCTILLRGASSEELKKVKKVMHYTVFAAYHLVLETSFFEDQRVFLNNNTKASDYKQGKFVGRKQGPSVISHESSPALSNINGHLPVRPTDNDVTCNGSAIEFRGDSNQALSSEKLPSSVSGSLTRLIDIFHHRNIYLPVTSAEETIDHQEAGRLDEISQETASEDFHAGIKVQKPLDCGENIGHVNDPKKQVSTETNQERTHCDHSVHGEHEQLPVPLENVVQHGTSYVSEEKISAVKDETSDVFDSQSILILMSSQCITTQVICEQSHLSRIKYYGNFDVSLGRYLQDILQNLNLSCSSCGEPLEAHMYSYTHRNGNLTVIVKRLLSRHRLPGESQGKIWMWTRCLRCEHESGITKSSQRVLLSTEARNLSFGRFLELSFSDHSAATKLSICGHLVNRDCLRFFGLGSKVVAFQYSPVEIYNARKPQPTLEFHNSQTRELFKQEGRNVLARGVTLFSEVATLLEQIRNQFPHAEEATNFPVKFSQLEDMMIKEKTCFLDSLVKAFDQGGMMPCSSVHELLDVNLLYQDLLLGIYAWDRRLHQLLLMCKSAGNGRAMSNAMKKVNVELTGDQMERVDDIAECISSQLSLEPLQFSEVGMKGHLSESVAENHWDEENRSAKVPSPNWEDRERWVWSPLCESRMAYRQELKAVCLEKFELVNHYRPSHLSLLRHKQSDEDPRYVIGPGSNVLCVSEDEISSIISRALAISEDRRHLLDALVQSETEYSSYSFLLSEASPSPSSSSSSSSSASSSWSSIGCSDSEASFSSDDLYNYDSSLLSSSLHPEISVNGKATLKGKYSVICVHANQFYDLRKKCCPSELAYITSLSRCKKWDAQGGKSKAFFAKTMDGRFIVKQIKKTEFESFIEFAPDYFKHVFHSLDTGSQTCLAKILGIYQVKQVRHGKEVKIDLMVMENLLFGHNVSRTYDLKGAVFSRYIADSSDRDTVYLDQNFVEDTLVSPIYISGRTKHLLQRAIWNDTSFLTTVNVMDYSLLVGVDKLNHEIVFGIIDYLRQYTWDKQLETWVKTSLVVPKNVLPTVISPREYKKRFRKFMAKYFLTVPDDWSKESSSGFCKSCVQSNWKSPKVNNEKPHRRIEACA